MWIVGLKWWLFLPDDIPDKTNNFLSAIQAYFQ